MREEAKDRISNLPESLLHHIHSFLHIEDGARTSALSKRWKYIWTTVPILHFQIPFSRIPETGKFMDFVDGALFRHASNVDKFFLHWDVDLNDSRVHSWISFVVRGKVKELGLYLRQEHPFFIPLSLFTCESLISLELQARANIHLPKCIRFPRLKRLKLVGFEISDECWNEELSSNSPVLEELIMEYCSVSVKFFCISIPTLKLLKISTWRVSAERNGIQDCVFKVHAPRLVTFSYSGYVAKEFVLSSFPELVEATVHFTYDRNGGEQTSRLLRALAHVKYLTIHNIKLQDMCSAYGLLNNLLTFHNVKVLNVAEVLTSEEGLLLLLKAVPNLESLVFDEFMDDKEEEDASDNSDGDNDNEDDEAYHNNEDVADTAECGKDDGWAVDIATTGCLFPHLKSVCFEEFAGNPTEIRWAKLILRYAKALQTMTIRYYDSDFCFVNAKSEKELMVDIPSFPRASAGCVIKFCSWDWKSVVFH